MNEDALDLAQFEISSRQIATKFPESRLGLSFTFLPIHLSTRLHTTRDGASLIGCESSKPILE